jgi:hypothetical protein
MKQNNIQNISKVRFIPTYHRSASKLFLKLLVITFLFSSILLAQAITVVYPNGGEQLNQGQTVNIQWTWTGNTTTAKIQLWNNGILSDLNTSAPCNTGSNSWPWTISPSLPYGTQYKIYIAVVGVASDYSNSTFTIGSQGAITVVYPNGGEQLYQGQTVNIQWTWTGNTTTAKIQLWNNGILSDLNTSAPCNTGSNSWPWTISIPYGTQCKICITVVGVASDCSDGYFTIGSQGAITVVYPNGGEQLNQGQTVNIQWTWTGNTTTAKIQLWNNGILSDLNTSAPCNTGSNSWPWTISPSLPYGTQYKIYIAVVGVASDYSNSTFTIGSPLQLQLSVTPTGSQTVDWGGTYSFSFAVTANGSPVSGATVSIEDPIIGLSTSRTTDVNGNASYSGGVPSGFTNGTYTFSFQALKSGYPNSETQTRDVIVNHGTPALNVNPTSVNINFFTPSQITIKNNGGGTLNWAVNVLPGWVGLSQTSGSLLSNQEKIVTISNVNYQPSDPNAAFTVVSNGGSQQVDVHYVTATTLGLVIASIVPEQTQEKDYGGLVTYTITVKDGNNNPVSGAKAIVNDEILGSQTETELTNSNGVVQYQTAAIPNGVLNGSLYNISFKAIKTGYSESGIVNRTIKVKHITDEIAISFDDTFKVFSAQVGGVLPDEQSVEMHISGGGNNAWQIVDKPDWLDVDPLSGTDNSVSISIQPNTTNLSPNNSPYDVRLKVQCTNAVNSPQYIHVRYSLTTTSSNEISLGTLHIKANTLDRTGGSIIRASGNVNVNNVIWFNGYIDVDTNILSPSLSGDCEMYVPVSGVPLLNKVTLYDGGFSIGIDVAGALKNFVSNNVRQLLKLGGIKATIKDIYLEENGIRIEGDIQFQRIFNINLHLTNILISTNNYPTIAGQVNINNVHLLPGLTLNKLRINFDQFNDAYAVDAFTKTPAIQVGCKFGISRGLLDSIELRAGGLNIPIGSTGLAMKSLLGGVFGLNSPPMEIRLKTNIAPMIEPNEISRIIQLENLGLSYFLPSTITGTGNLTLLETYPLADAYFTISYPSFVEFGGGIDIGGLFEGDAVLNLSFAPNWEVSGSLEGIIMVPGGEGFPWDVLESPPFNYEFPINLANTQNQFRNTLAWGSTTFNIWPINLQVAYSIDFGPVLQNNPPVFNFGVNGQNINNLLFANEITVDQLLHSKNKFEGMGLPVSSEHQNKYLNVENGLLNQNIPISDDYSKIIFRVTGQSTFPTTTLTRPDGLLLTPNDTLLSNANNVKYIADATNKKIFWVVDNPQIGNWTVSITSGGNNTLDVIAFEPKPIVEILNLENDVTTNEIQWTCSQVDTSTKVSLYYDNDDKNIDGRLFADSVLPTSGINTTFWNWQNDSVQPGTYYIYALIERQGEKFYQYSKGRLIIPASLQHPEFLTASKDNGKVKLQWYSVPEYREGYVIKYWDIGDAKRIKYLTIRDTNQITLDNILPGRDYKFSIEAFDSLNNHSAPTFSNTLAYSLTTVNNYPIIRFNSYDSLLSTVGENYQVRLPSVDKDGDNLLYSLVNAPNEMSISNQGILSWLPTINDTSKRKITVRIADGHGGNDSINFDLQVKNISAPEIFLDKNNYENLNFTFVTVKDNSANKRREKKDSVNIFLQLRNDSLITQYTNENNETATDFAYVTNSSLPNFSTHMICTETDASNGIFIGTYGNPTNIREINSVTSPGRFKLYQNYPNPFNSSTTIRYYISKPNDVKIEIFNVLGQKVTTLLNGFQSEGEHTLYWTAGNNVCSGMYFVVMQYGKFRDNKKVLLLK